MNRIAWELAAAMFIAFLLGDFSMPPIVFSLLAIHAAVTVVLWRRAGKPVLPRVVRFLRFLAEFLADLLKSNLQIARDVLSPRMFHKVRIVEVPIEGLSDREVVLLIHRITLTPGTMTCDVVRDGKALLVHSMYGNDAADFAQGLRRPLDILRGEA